MHDMKVIQGIRIAKCSLSNMNQIFLSIKISQKLRCIKYNVCSTLVLYEVKTRTLTKKMEHKIETFEFWVFKKVMSVLDEKRIKNKKKKVLEQFYIKRVLLREINIRKTATLSL